MENPRFQPIVIATPHARPPDASSLHALSMCGGPTPVQGRPLTRVKAAPGLPRRAPVAYKRPMPLPPDLGRS